MLKLFVFLNIAIIAGDRSPRLQLKNDLIKDRLILSQEHGEFNRDVIRSLRIFDAYANLSLAGHKFEMRIAGKDTISKWIKTTTPSLCIYEVSSIVPGDSIYREKIMNWDSVAKKQVIKSTRSIRLKPENYIFHTYIIKPATGKQLIYITSSKGGLHEYYIGKKIFYPLYESIALGVNFPDLDEILKLTATGK